MATLSMILSSAIRYLTCRQNNSSLKNGWIATQDTIDSDMGGGSPILINLPTGSSTSTVTLALSSGTFSSGSNTVTAAASAGVATFTNLAITAVGAYTLTATDGSLASAKSNPFAVTNALPASFIDNFNAGATDLTSKFTVTNDSGAGTALTWAAVAGIDDQTGPAARGAPPACRALSSIRSPAGRSWESAKTRRSTPSSSRLTLPTTAPLAFRH